MPADHSDLEGRKKAAIQPKDPEKGDEPPSVIKLLDFPGEGY